MRKVILIISSLGFLIVGIISASCSKDKDETGGVGCRCTETYQGYTEVYGYTKDEMKLDYDARNCSDLARQINIMDYDNRGSVSCSEVK